MNQGIVRGICISEKRGTKKKEVNEAVNLHTEDYKELGLVQLETDKAKLLVLLAELVELLRGQLLV